MPVVHGQFSNNSDFRACLSVKIVEKPVAQLVSLDRLTLLLYHSTIAFLLVKVGL